MKYILIFVGLLYSYSIFAMERIIIENQSYYPLLILCSSGRCSNMQRFRSEEIINIGNEIVVIAECFQRLKVYPQRKSWGMNDIIIRSEGKDKIFVQQGFELLGMTKTLRNNEDPKIKEKRKEYEKYQRFLHIYNCNDW